VKRIGRFDPNEDGPEKRFRASSTGYYGQVSLVEQLGATGDADAGKWLVDLDCFSAQWFDRLQPDLSDLPDWHQVAQLAQSRIVELTEAAQDLLVLFADLGQIGTPEAALGRWLYMRLFDELGGDEGTPVELYLPPAHGTDPALIAISGRQVSDARLEGLTLPSNEALAKLRRLTAMFNPQG